MKSSTKWILIFLAAVGVVGGAIAVAAQIYLAPFVKQQIEEKGTQALGAPIHIKSLSIGFFPPITANASEVEFAIPGQGIKGKIARLSIHATIGLSFDVQKAISDLKVRIVEPEIAINLVKNDIKKDEKPSPPSSPGNSSASPIGALGLNLTVERGKITVTDHEKLKYEIKELELATHMHRLDDPITLTSNFLASAPELIGQTNLPVQLRSTLSYANDTLTTDKTTIDVSGLKMNFAGHQQLTTGAGEWRVTIQAQNLNADTKVSDLELKGPVNGNLDATVLLVKNSPALKSLNLDCDLTAARLAYKNLFHKPQGTLLKILAVGATTGDIFKIENAKLLFDKLSANGSGSAPLPGSNEKISHAKFKLDRTTLQGWEKFLPSMSKSPLSGFIQAEGSFDGNLEDVKTYSVRLKPLKLEDIKGELNWQAEDKTKSLNGSAAIYGNVELEVLGSDVKAAKTDLQIDLSKVAISFKDTFEKPSNVTLRSEIHSVQKGLKEIEFQKTLVQLGSNQLSVTGTVSEPTQPHLNLMILAPKLSITELSQILPAMKKYGLAGQAKGNLKITGLYNLKEGIEKSPLNIIANVTADLPSVKCPGSPVEHSAPAPKAKPETTTTTTTVPAPLLPNWPVAKNAVVTSKVSIKDLQCKGITASGVGWTGTLTRGELTGSLTIQRIFDGKLSVQSLRTNLSQVEPDTEALVRTDGIDVNQAVTWFSAKWKDMIKGRLFGTNQVFVPDSSRPDFLQKTKVKGTAQLKNAYVSTLQLDEMINKALAKIPGVGNKEVAHSKGVAATISAEYTFANGVVNLNKFNFLSPEKNEINASGTVDLLQNAKLSGTAYLATAPVGGSVRSANSDPQGRLVLPFELNGNLSDPQVSFAEKTIQKLAENTAKKELDNLKSRAQEEGNKELQKKIEELKKNGLKGLFGK